MNRAIVLPALLFAVLWTIGMYLWNRPTDAPGIIGLIIAGLAVGFAWSFAMRWWFNRTARKPPP